MKIAIDESPIISSEKISHRVRGVGFYISNLKKSLISSYPDEHFFFFNEKNQLPKDISLIHYPYFDPFFVSLPFSQYPKIIVTVHDLTPLVFPHNFPVGIKGKLKWNIQRFLLQRSQRIITDSIASKRDIVRLTGVDEDSVDVVYLAASEQFSLIKDTRHLKNLKQKYKLPDSFVLYVGDVTWNKNLPNLLNAVKKLDVPLVLVGKAIADSNFDTQNPWNQDRKTVQKIIHKDNRFKSLGFVSNEDLPGIYNLASIFAMPSYYEGFGLPLLEAMNCGTPVVTSDKGSIPEVVHDAAKIVDPYDVDSIVSGMKEIFSDKNKREELIHKGFIQAKKFSWKETAQKTYQSYQKALQKR